MDQFNIFGSASQPFFAVEPQTLEQSLDGVTPEATDITAMIDGNTPTNLEDVIDLVPRTNGGLTPNLALVPDSIAIDTVNDGTCTIDEGYVDQRGVAKPQDGDQDGGPACDTGSFDTLPVFAVPPTGKCAGLQATIAGNNRADTIHGTNGVDVIASFGGNDLIYGLDDDDVICSGAGHDFIVAGDQDDRIFGGTENDRIFSEDGNDIAFGVQGMIL